KTEDKKPDKKEEKKGKKKASKKPADAKKTGKKGGNPANKDKPVPKDAKKVDKDETAAKAKKKVEAPPKGACDDAPDGAGACWGDVLVWCSGKELYALDCNEFQQASGFDAGSCYETDVDADCFGVVATEDPGLQVYCDPDENICCDSDGF